MDFLTTIEDEVASVADGGVLAAGTDHLYFVVGEEHYCADLARIIKVVLLTELRAVPMRPGYLTGLMNFGGTIVPVVDLASRLRLDVSEPYDLTTPVIICMHDGREVGLVVTSVDQVIRVADDEIQLAPMFEEQGPPCLGVVNRQGEQAFILDLDRVLDVDLTHTDTEGEG